MKRHGNLAIPTRGRLGPGARRPDQSAADDAAQDHRAAESPAAKSGGRQPIVLEWIAVAHLGVPLRARSASDGANTIDRAPALPARPTRRRYSPPSLRASVPSCLPTILPTAGGGYNDAVKTPTDEQLLASHLAGRTDAFELLVRRHSSELHRFVLRFTNSSVAADDVVQEAFLQAYVSAANFDIKRRLKPWLFTIAANKARDWLRSRARQSTVPLDAQIDARDQSGQTFTDLLSSHIDKPPAEVELEEQRRLVRRIVEQMPTLLREALILAYYHRFSYRQIAETLGIPIGTVKSRLHAAIGHFGQAYQTAVGVENEHDI